jgi:hypothetical protein
VLAKHIAFGGLLDTKIRGCQMLAMRVPKILLNSPAFHNRNRAADRGAYREYDDARARSLTEQAIAHFGRNAMLAVLEDLRADIRSWPLEERKRNFELAVLDKLEPVTAAIRTSRLGGGGHYRR